MDILDMIQEQFSTFSAKEKKIALYILQKNNEIKNINISKLAKLTNTSSATITRFCRKIGCDSFVDMKIAISSAYQDSPKEELEDGLFSEVFSFYNRVIDRTKKNLIKEDIEAFIKEIEKASRIFVYGVGSSGLTAMEFNQRLVRMGLNATVNTDSHLMVINSTIVKKDDLVIGISSSGATQEVLDSLRIAKSNGAKIVSITSFQASELSEMSDMSLKVYSSSFVDNHLFVNTQFALMYLIDVISMILLEDENHSLSMSQTIEAILKKPQ